MNLKQTVAVIGGGAVIAWVVLAFYMPPALHSIEEANLERQVSDISDQIQTTNGIKHIVLLDDIKNGGPPKDGIPSIDNPKFVQAQDAQFLSNDDLVIGLSVNGEARAYPLIILVWHEIVNDKFGDLPVAVTYCPLCFTTQVFDRTVNGKETEFGGSWVEVGWDLP